MSVNQPMIGDNQTDNSWKLEVTNQANQEEVRVNSLASRLGAIDGIDRTVTTGTTADALTERVTLLESKIEILETRQGAMRRAIAEGRAADATANSIFDAINSALGQ